jgi:hypothetical protein
MGSSSAAALQLHAITALWGVMMAAREGVARRCCARRTSSAGAAGCADAPAALYLALLTPPKRPMRLKREAPVGCPLPARQTAPPSHWRRVQALLATAVYDWALFARAVTNDPGLREGVMPGFELVYLWL